MAAKTKNSAGIQIVGLTTASVFLMSFAFLMYRLERSAPVEQEQTSYAQWRKNYLNPQTTARNAVEALIAKREAEAQGKAITAESSEPNYDFYNVLPEFSVYVSPDVANQRSAVAPAPVQVAAQARVITTAAAVQQPVIIQQQPVITYNQPVPRTDLIAARTVQQAARPSASEAPPTANVQPGAWLQVGAFSQRGDASRRRAEVALLGLRAHIEPAVIGGSTVFRVKLGPFDDTAARTAANDRLSMAGIESIIKTR